MHGNHVFTDNCTKMMHKYSKTQIFNTTSCSRRFRVVLPTTLSDPHEHLHCWVYSTSLLQQPSDDQHTHIVQKQIVNHGILPSYLFENECVLFGSVLSLSCFFTAHWLLIHLTECCISHSQSAESISPSF